MKKKTSLLSVLVALSILAVMVLSACEDPDPEYTVKYEITGPSSTINSVIYYNEVGNVETIHNVSVPWEKTLKVSGREINVGLGFVASYNITNTYTATIYVDGKVFKSANHSTGASIQGVLTK